MLRLTLLLLLCAACAPAGDDIPVPGSANPDDTGPKRDYATQVDVRAPDYARLVPRQPAMPKGELHREAEAPLPADAEAIGETWIARLEAKNALTGYGIEGKGQDGPVSSISTALTARDFDSWVAANGWSVPSHIRWDFVPELVAPKVSDAAAPAIRHWPASERRTGTQLEALLAGRVTMRDGCFWVKQVDEPEKLAWFNAETGLDRDAEGYLVLIDRYSGELRARIGEEMVWAGPNSVDKNDDRVRTYMRACGGDDVTNVGNPEAAERMYTRYPHTRP